MYRVRCVEMTHWEATGEYTILERLHDRYRGHVRWYVRDRDEAHRHLEAVREAHRWTP